MVVYTTLYLWLVDPKTPYYGYWEGRENEFTLFEMLKQILIYLFVFDAWFYATHHLLHLDWFMKHIHKYHHVHYFVNIAILRAISLCSGCRSSILSHSAGAYGTLFHSFNLSNEPTFNQCVRVFNFNLCFACTRCSFFGLERSC